VKNPLPPEQQEYDPLDYQLADLVEQLNTKKNKTLRKMTLEISKKTREGCIALACEPALEQALLAHKVVGTTADCTPLIIDNGFVYLYRYWSYQQRLAQQIRSRLANINLDSAHQYWIKQRLTHYFSHDNRANTDINWQQTASALAFSSRFLIISGGPGTGKTTTITRILALLIDWQQQSQRPPLRFSLAAPTGKAAMRMSESIRESIQREGNTLSDAVKQQLPQVASTIHRLLGYLPQRTEFRFNQHNHLASDIVIIDEASMIDLALMTKLFEAISPQATLILLGDKDQLSSVEIGAVFADLCASANNRYSAELTTYLQNVTGDSIDNPSDFTPHQTSSAIDNHIVCLLKSWRFNQTGGIGTLATAVNQGEVDNALQALKHSADIQLISPSELTVKQLIAPWQPYLHALKTQASIDDLFTAFNQFRTLSALRKGMKGCVYLNQQLEKHFSQQQQLLTGKRWYHGRPIMITENSYRTGLFNGDIGITLIDKGETKVWFQTNEGAKAFSPVRLPQHETAWVLTIHKSQGSEFEHVALLLPTEDTPILTRQLLYTGITRAKQHLDIISTSSILQLGIQRQNPQATQLHAVFKDEKI
jgi:exodeoxyribonuclease V alpha subunit